MSIRKFKRYFSAQRYADDAEHTPIWAVWVTNGEEATLINPASGRVYGYVCHDGCRKYYPTVFVSPWRAWQLLRRHQGHVVSLLPFPRLAIECFRVKSASIEGAQDYVEEILGSADPD